MENQLELALIKADHQLDGGLELYWLFSRNQIDFVLQEIDLVSTEGNFPRAKYQDAILPVIYLEKYYGLQNHQSADWSQYIVTSAVNKESELVRLILHIAHPLSLKKIAPEFNGVSSFSLPKRGDDILGVYSLSTTRIAVIPDIAKIVHTMDLTD